MVGKHILAYGKSMHAGQSGIVVADFGNYLLILADDPKYANAYKDSAREGKYFQVDALCVKQLKD